MDMVDITEGRNLEARDSILIVVASVLTHE
jgi:hypothetical protein